MSAHQGVSLPPVLSPYPLPLVKQITTHLVGSPSYFVGQRWPYMPAPHKTFEEVELRWSHKDRGDLGCARSFGAQNLLKEAMLICDKLLN